MQDRSRTTLPPVTLIFAAWLIPALLAGFNSYIQDRLSGEATHWRWVLFNSIDWLLYAVLTPFVFRWSRRFPLEKVQLRRNLAVHVAGALTMCVAWAGLGTLLRLLVFPIPPNATAARVLMGFVGWIFTTLPFGTGVYFALVGIEHSLYYFAQAREREVQSARLAAQLAEARLSALRMQLNPHFLFNSLNAITVLVRDQNTAAASRMLELLSDVLRQVLRADAMHETAMSEEIEFVERYLAIEQVRFADRLRPRVQVDPAVEHALVPSFVMQPLVENAIRHGISRRAGAGLLEIRATLDGDNVVLTVRDDGPGLTPGSLAAGGVGIANTRARLTALYGGRASLMVVNGEGGGVVATVRIPYHESHA